MNRFTLGTKYLLVALLAMSATAVAQTTSQTDPAWEAVKALTYDELLSIKLKNGTSVDGTLISASDTNLKLYRTSENPTSGIVYDDIVDLKKENIRNIYRLEKKSGNKWTFIGAAVGAAAGVALGSLGSNCQSSPGPFGNVFSDVCSGANTRFMVIGGVGGAAAGASIGHLIGRKRLKRVLVYESK